MAGQTSQLEVHYPQTCKIPDLKSSIKKLQRPLTQASTVSAFFVLIMAQPPPLVPPTAPPPTGPGPTTYLQLYQGRQDALGGDYAPLYVPYDVNSGKTPAELLDRLLAISDVVPKAFLALVVDDDGAYRTRTLHRVQRYPSHPVTTSVWDGKVFAFNGDVHPGNHIDLVEFPADAFSLVGPVVVPTIAQTTALLAAHPNQGHILPMAVGAQDTEQLDSRCFVQIPQAYLPLLLNRRLTPRELWEQVALAIIADSKEQACGIFLTWARVALVLCPDPADPANFLHPANCLGPAGTHFPPLAVDEALQHHRWSVLVHDLPALDPQRLGHSDQVLAVLAALRQDRLAEQAADAAIAAAARQPKLPSEAFPMTVPVWMRACGGTSERSLPALYHQWAQASKAERRAVFVRMLEQRASEAGAATTIVPVVSKELLETVLFGKFAPAVYEADDLRIGLHPFTCGYVLDNRGGVVESRAASYDLMLAGLSAPTFDEQTLLSTKEVPFPATTYAAGTQLRGCSLVLDVTLGPENPLARAYRTFCHSDWPQMEAVLNVNAVYDPTLEANVLPSILRWVQLNLTEYLRDTLRQTPAAIPAFHELRRLVTQRTYNLLPHIPARYQVTSASVVSTPPATQSVVSALTTPSVTPAPSVPPAAGRGGAQVLNPAAVREWKEAFERSGKLIRDLRTQAPKWTIRNQQMEVCLGYHLRGSCYENCNRKETHVPPSPANKTIFAQFVATVLNGTSAATVSTSAPSS